MKMFVSAKEKDRVKYAGLNGPDKEVTKRWRQGKRVNQVKINHIKTAFTRIIVWQIARNNLNEFNDVN